MSGTQYQQLKRESPPLIKTATDWRSPGNAPVPYRIFHFKLPGLGGGWYMEVDEAPYIDPARRRYVTDPATGQGTMIADSPARFASKTAALEELGAELARRLEAAAAAKVEAKSAAVKTRAVAKKAAGKAAKGATLPKATRKPAAPKTTRRPAAGAKTP